MPRSYHEGRSNYQCCPSEPMGEFKLSWLPCLGLMRLHCYIRCLLSSGDVPIPGAGQRPTLHWGLAWRPALNMYKAAEAF